jgi:hypothetical protein
MTALFTKQRASKTTLTLETSAAGERGLVHPEATAVERNADRLHRGEESPDPRIRRSPRCLPTTPRSLDRSTIPTDIPAPTRRTQ